MSAIGAPDYLHALERELADLAPDERADLLEEVEASLLELEEDPVARLGPPAQFAAELRESAGLPPVAAPVHSEPRRPLRERLKPGRRAHSALAFARELAPVWWALRAFVIVTGITVLASSNDSIEVPNDDPRMLLGLALLALTLAVSIGVGLAGRRRRLPLRAGRIALNVVLVAIMFPLAGILLDELRWDTQRVVFTAAYPPPAAGLAYDGERVHNIYPYDRNGRLLHDVRLFDESGRPLDVLRGGYNPNRATLSTRSGAELFNAFPIRYIEPGTGRVENPNAEPAGLPPSPLVNSRRPSSP
jgi:hypothetical protein